MKFISSTLIFPQKMKIRRCVCKHLQDSLGIWIVTMHLASIFVVCTYAITYKTNICKLHNVTIQRRIMVLQYVGL